MSEKSSNKNGIYSNNKNPINNIRKAVLDRFGNPLFYSFIISWALFNWDRISIFIFSKQNIVDRIKTIKELPSSSLMLFDIPYATTFWFPLASTIFIVVLGPFISLLLDMIHKWPAHRKIIENELLHQNSLEAKRKSVRAEVYLDMEEESIRLRVKAEDDRNRAESREHEENIEHKRELAQSLNETINTLQNSHETLSTENERLRSNNIGLVEKNNEIMNSINISAKELQTTRVSHANLLDEQRSLKIDIDNMKSLKPKLSEATSLLLSIKNSLENGILQENTQINANELARDIDDFMSRNKIFTSTS